MNNCPICKKEFAGRSDKRFCSDKCRAASFYEDKAKLNQYKRHVHEILERNRKILAMLNPQGKCTVSKVELEEHQFNFKFFTGVYRTKGGSFYWFCYDQGFRKLQSGEKYLLVKRQDYMEH